MAPQEALRNGPAAAAMAAAGIGSLAMGVLTTLGENLEPIKAALNFYNPVGSLSGKSTGAVVVWLLAWILMRNLCRNRQVDLDMVLAATLIMIALGLLGTFPPFFTLFGK